MVFSSVVFERFYGSPKTWRGIFALLSLGLRLARSGFLAITSIVISVLTAIVVAIVTIVLVAKNTTTAPLHDMPIVASSAIAWGGGFTLAFASAAHALRKDRTEGLFHLVVDRTLSLRGYVVARACGLSLLLALVVAGGTAFCGLVAIIASARISAVPKTLQATVAAIVFSLAFAAIVGPVSLAALGARSRIGGYLFLIGVMVLPELLVGMLAHGLPESVTELFTVPSALGALRSALAPGSFDPLRFVRALAAVTVMAFLATLVVRRDIRLLIHAGRDA